MSEEELQKIEERVKAATPGPWYAIPGDKYDNEEQRCEGIGTYSGDKPPGSSFDFERQIVKTDSGVYPPKMSDALFISHSISDIPKLIEEVRRLLTENREFRSGLKKISKFTADYSNTLTSEAKLAHEVLAKFPEDK